MAQRDHPLGKGGYIARFLRHMNRVARREPGPTTARRAREPTAPSYLAEKKILIVELDRGIYGRLAGQFEQLGCRARMVSGPGAALEVLAQENPALLIVLGPADLAFYGALRRACSAPILALSAGASEEEMLDAFAVGVDQFQPSPIPCNEAVARALALLRRNVS